MSASQEKSERLKKANSQALEVRREVSWNEIGDAFETMGKVGLAMAIGMSAAGLFCRLAEQGKVRVPTLTGLLTNRPDSRTSENRGKSRE